MKFLLAFLALAISANAAEPPKPRIPAEALVALCQPATENVFDGEGREIIVLGTSWCQYCPAAKSAAEANGVPYFDAEKSDKGRELAKRHGVNSYPRILVFEDGDYQYAITQADWPSAIRREAGKSSPVKSSPVKSKPAKPYQKPQVVPSGLESQDNYQRSFGVSRISSQRWTWPGSLRNHLLSEIQHTSKLSPSELAAVQSMSQSDLQTVHDNLHNTGRSGISVGTVRYQPRTYYQPANTYCPSCRR